MGVFHNIMSLARDIITLIIIIIIIVGGVATYYVYQYVIKIKDSLENSSLVSAGHDNGNISLYMNVPEPDKPFWDT